nr:MAG: hypothetical protein [Molluscum contagiosum virus]
MRVPARTRALSLSNAPSLSEPTSCARPERAGASRATARDTDTLQGTPRHALGDRNATTAYGASARAFPACKWTTSSTC